jgi:hypothetical protein
MPMVIQIKHIGPLRCREGSPVAFAIASSKQSGSERHASNPDNRCG